VGGQPVIPGSTAKAGITASKAKNSVTGEESAKSKDTTGGTEGEKGSALPLPVGPEKPAQKENVGPEPPKDMGSKGKTSKKTKSRR